MKCFWNIVTQQGTNQQLLVPKWGLPQPLCLRTKFRFLHSMSSILNREDFILNSDSGKFIVKKDELLVGNVRMVHRDERIFDQPHKFLPARFENKVKFYSSLRFEE